MSKTRITAGPDCFKDETFRFEYGGKQHELKICEVVFFMVNEKDPAYPKMLRMTSKKLAEMFLEILVERSNKATKHFSAEESRIRAKCFVNWYFSKNLKFMRKIARTPEKGENRGQQKSGDFSRDRDYKESLPGALLEQSIEIIRVLEKVFPWPSEKELRDFPQYTKKPADKRSTSTPALEYLFSPSSSGIFLRWDLEFLDVSPGESWIKWHL